MIELYDENGKLPFDAIKCMLLNRVDVIVI